MKNVGITISGNHRGKSCSVTFARRGKDWAAEIAIEGELHERATNDKPCMATAERMIDEILLPAKKRSRKSAWRVAKPKLFESDE